MTLELQGARKRKRRPSSHCSLHTVDNQWSDGRLGKMDNLSPFTTLPCSISLNSSIGYAASVHDAAALHAVLST